MLQQGVLTASMVCFSSHSNSATCKTTETGNEVQSSYVDQEA
jgi:hypothetical protein